MTSNLSNIKSIEQLRAKYAYQYVTNFKKENPSNKDYKTLVRKLPSLIVTNGLSLTIAYIKSRNSELPLMTHLLDYLKERKIIPNNNEITDLFNYIINNVEDTVKYRYLTSEILAFSIWLKRVSETEL